MKLSDYLIEAVARRTSGKYIVDTPIDDGTVYFYRLLDFLRDSTDFKPYNGSGEKDMRGSTITDLFYSVVDIKREKFIPIQKIYQYGTSSRGKRYILVSGNQDKMSNVPIMYIEFNEIDGKASYFVLKYFETTGEFNFAQQGNPEDMDRMIHGLKEILGI